MSSTDQPGHGDFITSSSSTLDWRNPQNDNLWQGVNGINNPCPSGYSLPTYAELDQESVSWNSQDEAGAFASALKLPVAGSFGTGDDGKHGYYWSSTVSSTTAFILDFDSSIDNLYAFQRGNGFSVRCIKD